MEIALKILYIVLFAILIVMLFKTHREARRAQKETEKILKKTQELRRFFDDLVIK